MAGKSVLVTGDTGGMGKTTAIGLAGWAPGPASPAVIRPAPRRPCKHPRRVGRDVPRAVTFRGHGQPAGE